MNSPAPAPLISVCIANYNGIAIIDDCLRSVLDQVVDGSIEIIVHDDASTDSSMELLATYHGVKVIHSEKNIGFCESNNRMVDVSRGDYVLLLNNDAALLPGALQALLDDARRSPRHAILTLPQRDWATDQLVDRGCLLDPFMNPVPNVQADRNDVAMVIGACMWLPRALWDTLGGFPSWIGSIAEDMYLCCAARQRGYDVRCLPDTGYRHRQGASFGGNRVDEGRLVTTYRRRALSEKNKTFLLAIFTPSAAWLVLLAIHLLVLLAEGATLTLLRRDRRLWSEVYLAAAAATWVHRVQLMTLRRDLQKKRSVDAKRYYSAFTWLPRKVALLLRYGLPTVR
ncbi:glycosyl transferase [Luteibacter rhizovicinus DSM 16549]|uniref:Glycosyl transferase n=1 Tax=Luteibacter rhizovicinus DSM 16549 TaxID=1440763 RepID=A0A0G9HEV1_9GAMM|nr:glycosyltransferase [Luteibacter rhizovicinus]APG04721.1 glycosyl transferase [Luteibacter rhizovicinus DSM 16549]KLD68213.1 glycosyl transferase [Luteibacter rhizovicinus DSM 16549]KLD78839.1 glycosyl transferase [Xanthomonas hyacinthi DSM 19077]